MAATLDRWRALYCRFMCDYAGQIESPPLRPNRIKR